MVLRSGDGVPDALVVDHDPKFTSKLFREFTRRLGSSLLVGLAYHKNTNARTERVKGDLGDTLRAFAIEAAKRGKPILAYKLGRSAEARELAVSHTGALAGEDDVADVFLAECGIARVDTLEGLIEGFPLLARVPAPKRGASVMLPIVPPMALAFPPPRAEVVSHGNHELTESPTALSTSNQPGRSRTILQP